MADDDDDNKDSNAASHHGFGFVALPGSIGQLLENAAQEHERHHMQIESIEMRINNFLDSLNVEQLLMLRKVLNCDRDSGPNNYFDGMVVTLLRVVHHVDQDGRTHAEVLRAEDARKEA